MGMQTRLFGQGTDAELSSKLLSFEKEYEQINVLAGKANWDFYTSNEAVDIKSYKKEFHKLLTGETLERTILKLKNSDTLVSDTLKRRVEIFERIMLGGKVNFDPEVLELQSKIESWLSTTNTEVEKPSQEIMVKNTIELMKLRNKKARELGYKTYPEMVLELSGVGVEWFFKFVDQIIRETEPGYLSFVSETTNGGNTIDFMSMRKGLVGYYMAATGLEISDSSEIELMSSTLLDIGADNFSGIEILKRALPPGVGGQGIAISVPDDFRIVVPEEFQFSDLMHEAGHGLHWKSTKTNYPILKGYEWCLGSECGAFAEGIAETISKLVNQDSWRKKYVSHISSKPANQDELKKLLPVFLRFHVSMLMFEHEFYKDLDQNPNDVVDRLNKKYLFVEEPVGRYRPISDLIYISYPVYLHSYIMGEIISWQIGEELKSRFGDNYTNEKKVYEFLQQNLFESGAYITWRERLKNATGKELDVTGYLKHMSM